MKTRVLIADDHPILRNGLKMLVESNHSYEVVAEAANGQEAVEKIHSFEPEIVLLDISMPIKNGLQVLKECQEASCKFIILSNYEDEEYIIDALKLGAKSYLLKDTETSDILTAMDAVINNQNFYNQRIANILVNQLNKIKEEELTPKEKEIIKHIANGMSSKMIATEMNISSRTAEAHRYNILKKLGANNTAELIKIAYDRNLI